MQTLLRLLLVAFVALVQQTVAAQQACQRVFNPGFEISDGQFSAKGWNENDAPTENPYCQRSAYYPASGQATCECGANSVLGIGYAEQFLQCMDRKKTYRLQVKVGHTMCQGDANGPCYPPTLHIYLDQVLVRSTLACGPKSIPCTDGLNSAKFWTLQVNGLRPEIAKPKLRFEWEFPVASSKWYHGLIDDVMIIPL